MSQKEKQSETLTAQPHHEIVARALEENLSPLHTEAYRVARQLFPCTELDTVSLVLSDRLASYHGGPFENEDGSIEPRITIGMQQEPASRNLKRRLVSRFGVPLEAVDDPEFGHLMRTLIILPHEIGHIVQMSRTWREKFGGIEDGFILPSSEHFTDEEYELYIASEAEGNAEYIAAAIVAATSYGENLGISGPGESPDQWRKWVAAHPVEIGASS